MQYVSSTAYSNPSTTMVFHYAKKLQDDDPNLAIDALLSLILVPGEQEQDSLIEPGHASLDPDDFWHGAVCNEKYPWDNNILTGEIIVSLLGILTRSVSGCRGHAIMQNLLSIFAWDSAEPVLELDCARACHAMIFSTIRPNNSSAECSAAWCSVALSGIFSKADQQNKEIFERRLASALVAVVSDHPLQAPRFTQQIEILKETATEHDDDELTQLSVGLFNIAIDAYEKWDDFACKRWSADAKAIAGRLHDDGVLLRLLEDKMKVLL